MTDKMTTHKQRQRAPSQRAIATRERILDAAERIFATHGFDGASMREIAAEAGEQVGLVHHHGGGKEELFRQTIARRAQELSAARLGALAEARAHQTLTLHSVLTAFSGPYLTLARTGPQWSSYARLVAHVSADPRWESIASECFDPTAQLFLDEISKLLPDTPRSAIATGFVFTVSAMLALLTSQWRITALADAQLDLTDQLEHLVTYCAAGIMATSSNS